MAMTTKITKDNAASFLLAQIYLLRFTADDPTINIMIEAIEIVLEENKELKKEIEKLKADKSNDQPGT